MIAPLTDTAAGWEQSVVERLPDQFGNVEHQLDALSGPIGSGTDFPGAHAHDVVQPQVARRYARIVLRSCSCGGRSR